MLTVYARVVFAKTHKTLPQEFTGCVDTLIQKTNSGQINTNTRGKKKENMANQLADDRQKTAKLVIDEGIRCRIPMKAIHLDTYMVKNPTCKPKEDGLLLRMINWPGFGPRQCLLLRKNPNDESDVDIETSIHSKNGRKY